MSPELDPRLRHVDLAQLDAAAALRDRLDRKYLVARTALPALLERLAPTHAVLEIDGRRRFAYASTYYDTPDLRSFRDHLQGRRRRYKLRRREYVDAGTTMLEVKLKEARGRTCKRRAPWPGGVGDGPLGPEAAGFLDAVLRERYGRPAPAALAPALRVDYERITLADLDAGDRLTCDLGLRFASPHPGGRTGRLLDTLAVVEVKSARGAASPADRTLRALGARPVGSLSKYLLGVALTRDDVKANPVRPLMRRTCERALA